MKIRGNLVDIHERTIYPVELSIADGRIEGIMKMNKMQEAFIMPGLIDAHIHIESSMVSPGAFAMEAVKHGTTGVVSDPHEIANVMGIDGINYMIEDSKKVPMRFWFGAPSCVPATDFESAGAILGVRETEMLLQNEDIKYLSEMMNFPGVIYNDEDVRGKLAVALRLGKPIDGHAPGLSGENLRKYINSGISTDHECSTIDEAKEKIGLGMKILIREGSAARNLKALKGLYKSDHEKIMICSDDLHPEMLKKRHINKLLGSLISEGYDVFDVIRSATINPVNHYGLEAGLLKVGDRADFILVNSLEEMDILGNWIEGKEVFDGKNVNFTYQPEEAINNFNCSPIDPESLILDNDSRAIKVIEAFDGELFTKKYVWEHNNIDSLQSDVHSDILKIVVKDRYNDAAPSIGFIKGFGLKWGAFASSVAHDSHNIIAVGANDNDIVLAINEIVKMKGGLAVVSDKEIHSIQLNIGGIMTTRPCTDVAYDYERLSNLVKSLGCTMKAPFMSLSFMALLVIPELKIGDKGLFDGIKFELTPLFVD